MRNLTLLLLSGSFVGFTSYGESKKFDPQIGDDSQKGPPGLKTIDLAYLNGEDRTIAIDETANNIISSTQMGNDSANKLSDDHENTINARIRKRNQLLVTRLTTPIYL